MLDVSVKDRNDLLEKMVTQACNAGIVRDKDIFLENILQREALTPTIIGRGVAVPHAHSGDADGRVVVVFARLKAPIRYSEENPELVRLVFMVATGTNEREYLNVLRLIATNISDASVHQRLLSANDVHEVHHLLSELKTTQPLTTQSE
jgi:mannitol/fructose-specific phosphotransferase system IIA component (Ntr-type)